MTKCIKITDDDIGGFSAARIRMFRFSKQLEKKCKDLMSLDYEEPKILMDGSHISYVGKYEKKLRATKIADISSCNLLAYKLIESSDTEQDSFICYMCKDDDIQGDSFYDEYVAAVDEIIKKNDIDVCIRCNVHTIENIVYNLVNSLDLDTVHTKEIDGYTVVVGIKCAEMF